MALKCSRGLPSVPLLASLGLAGLLAACSNAADPTAPGGGGGNRFTASITVQSVSQPTYGVSPDGVAILSCIVLLQAEGHGRGGASWSGATFRFYPGTDLRSAFDSVVFTAQDVANSWGNGSLSVGPVQTSGWNFSGTIPFTLALDYRYRPTGAASDSTASAQFTCQPTIPANAQPPAITGLTLQPAGGTIEPGDTLAISFTAAAPAGLWQTIIDLKGTCDTTLFFPGQLARSASYSVRLPVTRGCTLNATFGVSVLVLDAAVRVASTGPVQFRVTDLTPPQLIVSYGGGAPAVSGDFFTGDTLNLEVDPIDNDQVSYLTWQVLPAGIVQSVPLSALRNPPFLPVQVGAAWGAAVQLRFSATDRSGNRSAFSTLNTDSLRIHPAVSRLKAVRTLTGEIRQIMPDSKRGVFYVLLGNEQQLLTLSLGDASTIRILDLPSCGTSFDLTASGDSLLFVCPITTNLGVLDLTAPVPQFSVHRLTTPDTLNGQVPGRVFGMANGKAIIGLGGPAPSQAELLEVDLTSWAESLRSDGGSATGVFLIERSPNHDRLIAGDHTGMVEIYNSATDQFGPLTMPPNNGGSFWFSADGQVLVEGTVILDQGLHAVGSVRNLNPGGVTPSVLTPDGQRLFYGTSQGLVQARLSDGQLVDRSTEPLWSRDMRITDDGLLAVFRYAESSSSGQVGVIDLR